MIRELTALEGESLYDLTIRAYGDMRGYPYILLLNTHIDSGVAVPTYKLNFDETNEDYVDFGELNSLIDFEDFTLTANLSNLLMPSSHGVFGKNFTASKDGSWGIRGIFSNIEFYIQTSIGTVRVRSSLDFISGEVKIIGTSDGINHRLEMYIDGVLDDFLDYTNILPSEATTNKLLFGAFDSVSGVDRFLTGSIRNVELTSFGITTIWQVNEGSGNTVTSNQGDVGTIQTSNAGGQSYIDATMWQQDGVISVSNLQGQTIYYDDSLLFPRIVPESFIPEREFLDDYLILQGQSMYDLAVQLYGDTDEGIQNLLPYLKNTDQGTLVKRKVPVSNIGEQFNDQNVIVATDPVFEVDERISLEMGLEGMLVGDSEGEGGIFDETFDNTFN